MHSLVWMLTVGIVQCAILASNDYRLSDCIVQFSGLAVTVPRKYAKESYRTISGKKYVFPERKTKPSLSGLCNAILVRLLARQTPSQGCLDSLTCN